jgi:hypothetical protein
MENLKELDYDINVDDLNNIENDSAIEQPLLDEEVKRHDPTEAELREYFIKIKRRERLINIKKGAKEFSFENGNFTCIARDEANANRKYRNWLKK